jgi:hypothetical protein
MTKPAPESTFTDRDRAILLEHISNARTGYVEYGMGESTTILVQNRPMLPAWSVESDEAFLLEWKQANGFTDGKLIHAHLGSVKSWGYPSTDRYAHLWPAYCLYPYALYSASCYADLVFVDGRFRVACAISSLLSIRHDFTLLVHDFTRAEYALMLKYFEFAEGYEAPSEGNSLAVLRPKLSWNWLEARQDLYLLQAKPDPAC